MVIIFWSLWLEMWFSWYRKCFRCEVVGYSCTLMFTELNYTNIFSSVSSRNKENICFCLCSQILKVRIINVEEYEKQENFFIVLEDPKWLKRGLSGKCMCEWVCLCVREREREREKNNYSQVFSWLWIVWDDSQRKLVTPTQHDTP